MDRCTEEQIKIFCLFLLADGERTSDEGKKLTSICRKMKVEASTRKEMERSCREMLDFTDKKDNSDGIIQAIDRLLQGDSLFLWGRGLDDNKEKQISTIWNLMNLGYADHEYSPPEQKIVSFLCRRWNVDAAIMEELQNSADTLLSLYKQKEWVETTITDEEEKKRYQRVIKKDINRVSKNIEITISEADLIEG